MQRFRGGLVFKAHRLFVSLNSRLESNKEEEDLGSCFGVRVRGEGAKRAGFRVQELVIGIRF